MQINKMTGVPPRRSQRREVSLYGSDSSALLIVFFLALVSCRCLLD